MAAAAPALALEQVTITFVSPDAARYTAVRDTTLRVEPGEFVSVVGPTGCGKSTLLNVAAGLLQPSAGRVEVLGAPLQGLNTKSGYLFQSDALMPWRTARANVAAGLEFRGTERREASARAQEWLQRGIDHFERLYAESERITRVMAVSIHPYITGAPHRIGYLERLYEHMQAHPGVLMWTGEQILDWYKSAARVR